MNNPANAVEFDNVSFLFGTKPGTGLPLMDGRQDRPHAEIRGSKKPARFSSGCNKTASPTVKPGRDSLLL